MEQKQAGLFNRTKLHVFRDWLTGRPSTVRCRRRRTGVDDWIPKNRSTIHNCVEESSLVSACTLKENELEMQGQKSPNPIAGHRWPASWEVCYGASDDPTKEQM